MNKIIRSTEQISRLKDALEKALSELPSRNAWGESNAESKAELSQWILELDSGESGEVVDPWSEIGYWLTNEKATLGRDYEIE